MKGGGQERNGFQEAPDVLWMDQSWIGLTSRYHRSPGRALGSRTPDAPLFAA